MAESRFPQERRTEPRVRRQEQLFARIAGCPSHPEMVGTVLKAASEDLSRGGLRVRVDRELALGTTFELWVKIKDAEGTFLLHGTVRWQEETETNGEYMVGLQLRAGNDPRTDDRQPWNSALGQAPRS